MKHEAALISFVDRNEIARKIFNDRVRALHENLSTISIPATVLCATLIYLGLYQVETKALLLSWYLSILAVCALRIGLMFWYRQDSQHPALHLKWFTFATTLAGIIWGWAGTVLAPPENLLARVFIIIVIAGLNAGGCQTLRASRTANWLFMLTSIVPLGLWALLQEQTIYTYLSLAIFGYLGFMLGLANKIYVQFTSSLQLQYENELLLKNLKEVNQELQDEIIGHEKAKTQLRYLASHDFLTGIDNRFSFDFEFDKIMTRARIEGSEFCVIYVDIDHFKSINDNYGHAFGDRILVEVALQLKKQLRPQDSLARIGGDEFIILMTDKVIGHTVSRFLQGIKQAFTLPLILDGHPIMLSISIGSSIFPKDGDNKKALLKKADLALYRAKTRGRNRHEAYQEEASDLE